MSFLETVKETWCIPLGKIVGVPILSHVTFWAAMIFLIGWAGVSWLFLLLFVFSVLLHELGHVFAAKHYGLRIEKIVLSLGAAALIEVPRGTRQELFVSLAGPVVSFLLAVLFLVGSFLFPVPAAASPFLAWATPYELCFWLGLFNLIIASFNLLPVFPTDGGRALRSLLTNKFGLLGSTKIVSGITLVVTSIVGGLALFAEEYIIFALVIYLFLLSQAEYRLLKEETSLRQFVKVAEEAGLTVRQPLSKFSLGKFLTIFLGVCIFWSLVAHQIALETQVISFRLVFVGLAMFLTVVGLRWAKPLYSREDDDDESI